MLLCDYAEEINGKLYVMGGGWSQLFTADAPTNMGLAIKVSVPWDQANRPHDFSVRLVTDDEQSVLTGDEQQPVELQGKLEVGRPPGLRPGTYLDSAIALNLQNLVLPAGLFHWKAEVDGSEVAHIPFSIFQPR
jgi:hypothetical protein